ncbi:hydrogenase formation protein HypD [Nitrosomonas sp.]|uniref:hydrogenase formation protein HypD n=1 Tax=Nitrosomonas sp. TaxID=42353 RepID=UPI002081EED5|nr:hydrogenase formation protein HypD [Nitrosomonas sp.]GJL74319.1 MAG: hydrogenase expression/formation protein hypD2 [Nitrosomonas sp.]
MKYIDAFRDGTLAKKIARNIAAETNPHREYYLMEFCGGHTHAISRYGIVDLLPDNIHMIHGPGCPVCVLPMGKLENMIQLAQTPGLILCSYGDMLRIPTAGGSSLLKIKARGADIRMIYSSADALKIAQQNPQRQVVFLAIGFETTTPPTAVVIKQAQALGLTNFTVFCNHVLTPSAISHILQSPELRQLGLVQLDGFIGPAHVSTVIGSKPYHYFAEEFQKPVVIAGFEPLDVMQAILMLIRQLNAGRAEVENEFTRAVLPNGNLKAQLLVAEVFELRRSYEWRGLGLVPYSALRIKSSFAYFDAEQRFEIPMLSIADNKACECGAILRGVKHPRDCKIFGTVCTPENPVGSCMVSSEGACAAYYRYGRFRESRPENAVTKN